MADLDKLLNIQASVKSVLDAELDEKKRAAIVALATPDGASIGVAVKVNGTWRFTADASRDWSGHTAAKVAIIGSW